MSLNYDLRKLDPVLRAEMFPPQEATRNKWDDEKNDYARDSDGNIITETFEAINDHLQSLIFWTMPIGIGKITIDNYRTAFYRYLRASDYRGLGDSYLTLRHFRASVGLVTNVVTETDAAWSKRRITIEAELSNEG